MNFEGGGHKEGGRGEEREEEGAEQRGAHLETSLSLTHKNLGTESAPLL